jgi:hypothetical protein
MFFGSNNNFKKGQKMNRILINTLASAALCFVSAPQSFATPATAEGAHPGHEHHEKMQAEKSSEEIVKEIEDRLSKVKDAGAALSAEMKSEYDYYMDLVAVEIKALKDATNKNLKRHQASAQRAVNAIESMIKKHVHQVEHAKKVEEREAKAKAKAEERKARAEERKAKAEARKAEREAAKAKREADKAASKQEKATEKAKEKELVKEQSDAIAKAEKSGEMDHGRFDGGSTDEPGTDAAKPTT